MRRFEPRPSDGLQRVRELFDKTFPLFKEFEPHMRAAAPARWSTNPSERMGLLEEEPLPARAPALHAAPGGGPLRATLGERTYERLLKALR